MQHPQTSEVKTRQQASRVTGKYFLIACLLKYTTILNICIWRQVLILTHPCYGFVTVLSLFVIFLQAPSEGVIYFDIGYWMFNIYPP